MKALFDAINDKFKVYNPFYADINGRMYFTQASQKAIFPYCVYSLISDMYEYQFTEEFSNIKIQFSIFDNAESSVNIEKYFEDLKTLYDWCTLSVSGYTSVYMRREQSRLLRDDRAWHRAVDYRCYLEKN